jgi:hypothetical protein
VRIPEGACDERGFEMIRRIRAEHHDNNLSEFKKTCREQFFMILLDARRAVEAIPQLLVGREEAGQKFFEMIRKVATAPGPLGKEADMRLSEIKVLFIPVKPEQDEK